MSRLAVVLAVALLSGAFTGCLGDQSEEDQAARPSGEQEIDPASVAVPEGAELEELEDGVRLLWTNPQLPLDSTLEVPQGTTVVNATAQVEGEARARPSLTHERTGLARCQPPAREDLLAPSTGTVSCSALTAPDSLPASWNLSVDANVSSAERVQVDFRSIPLDGRVGQLDLDSLLGPQHELAPVESRTVQGANGTSLHVEVHRPQAAGPFPAVLVSRLATNASAQAASGAAAGLPADAVARELAARGYAVAVADVRGTGASAGCLDAWGPRESADQARLVEWLSELDWTTDQVGAVGFGYAATTALEAAVAAPDQVDAVVSFEAVTDAYRDWHFGGVPNGEGVGDLYGGQMAGALGYAGAGDRLTRVAGNGAGSCEGAPGYGQASDPRAVYNEFYQVRNLTDRASGIQAPVLHAQGTFDQPTKPSMATDWLDEVEGPHLSIVGSWGHQLPTRADAATLVVAWLHEHVKGADVGFQATAETSVTTPSGLQREVPTWPPDRGNVTELFPDFDANRLQTQPVDGSAEIVLDPVGATTGASASGNRTLVQLSGTLEEPTNVSGAPEFGLDVQLEGMENAFVAAYLEATLPDGTERTVSFGMANLAHRAGHGSYEPVPPGSSVDMGLPMQPTEMALPAGTELDLTIRSAATTDWSLVQPGRTGQLTLLGGAGGTVLELPTSPDGQLDRAPASLAPPAAEPT